MDTEDYLPLPLYVFETRIFEDGREEGFVVPVRGALDHCYLIQMTDDPTNQRRHHSPSAESPLSGYLIVPMTTERPVGPSPEKY